MPNTHLTFTVRNDIAEIVRLVDRLEAFGPEAGLLPDVAYRLTLALDEVVSNVIRHGFSDGGAHDIAVAIDVADGVVSATVTDDGDPYDPREAPLPDFESPLDQRRIGGLGMHLVREMMDRIDYRREDGRNVLTVSTALSGREEAS